MALVTFNNCQVLQNRARRQTDKNRATGTRATCFDCRCRDAHRCNDNWRRVAAIDSERTATACYAHRSQSFQWRPTRLSRHRRRAFDACRRRSCVAFSFCPHLWIASTPQRCHHCRGLSTRGALLPHQGVRVSVPMSHLSSTTSSRLELIVREHILSHDVTSVDSAVEPTGPSATAEQLQGNVDDDVQVEPRPRFNSAILKRQRTLKHSRSIAGLDLSGITAMTSGDCRSAVCAERLRTLKEEHEAALAQQVCSL